MPQAIALALGSALFSIGAPLAAVNFFAIGFGATLISTVIGVGLSLAAGALLRPSVPTISPSDGQQTVKEALAARRKSYGTVRVSGAMVFFEAVADVLWMLLAINHGRIAEIVSFHLDDNEVEIDGSDEVITAPYAADDVFLHSRLGSPTETAYAELETEFGLEEMRGDGVATILGTFQNPADAENFSETYPNSRPLIRVTINASVVWDPRESGQDRDTPSTWEFSDNPVVCLLDYMTSADGYGIPYELIEDNLAEWITAMDICDEEVALLGGGTGKRYRIALTYSLTDNPKDVVARFEASCDGKVWPRRDGSIGIVVGRFTAPVVTIESRDILGYSELTKGQDNLSAIAGIRAQYMSPVHDYREHEAEPWPSGEAIVALDEDRVATLDLSMVPSEAQTRRLMKRAYLRATATWRGTIVTNLSGLRAIDERFINVVIDELGIDQSFEVGRFSIDPNNLTCEIEILSVGPEIDDWSETEESVSDAGAFAFVSSFSKTGTAVDPIVEALGENGQTAMVFCAVGGGAAISATPAGWTLIQSAGPTSSLAFAAFRKVLDGSEVSTTFLAASGAIIVVLMNGAPTPTTEDLNIQISTSVPTPQTKEAVAAPYAVFGFGACLANQADADWLTLGELKTDLAEEEKLHSTGAGLSGAVKLIVYQADETPADVAAIMTDEGTNGLQSVIMRPGS